jgi:uncharacterized protein
MRQDTPLRVHVGDLLRSPGSSRPFHTSVSVDWGVELSRVAVDVPIEIDVELTSLTGGMMVRGRVTATLVETCSRCLEDARRVRTVEVAQLVEPADEGSDQEYVIDGDELDLEPVLRDELLLASPLGPRCDPPCAGLVRDSESDLNTESAGRPGLPDSPFAALQDLFDAGD